MPWVFRRSVPGVPWGPAAGVASLGGQPVRGGPRRGPLIDGALPRGRLGRNRLARATVGLRRLAGPRHPGEGTHRPPMPPPPPARRKASDRETGERARLFYSLNGSGISRARLVARRLHAVVRRG
jgi:hypothetical protein